VKSLNGLNVKKKESFTHHGMAKGAFYSETKNAMKVENHPFFGMNSRKNLTVAMQIKTIRKERFEP